MTTGLYQPSAISDLSTRFRVERSVVENDLALFASLDLAHPMPIVNNRENFTVLRPRLAVAFEIRFRKLLVSRIRGLSGCAFPRGAGSVSLLSHRAIETLLIEGNT